MAERRELKGFRLSRTGNADQVVLLSHGGWSPIEKKKKKAVGDGYMMIPKGVLVAFYTEHTVTNVGFKCTATILEAGAARAAGGFTDVFVPPPKPQGVSDEDFERMVGPVRADFHSKAVRVRDVFGDATGQRLVQCYNYSLSFEHRTNEEEIWVKHQTDRYDGTIDLLMLTKKAKTVRLSDAIEIATQLNEGVPYKTFHYAPCRYTEAGQWYSDLR